MPTHGATAFDGADPADTIRLDDDADPIPTPPVAARLDQALSLGGVLGSGGMAVVREAHQRVLDRTVAVKSAREQTGVDPSRLVTEARIIGALEHPGILPVHDILQDADGLPHIVLKRVEGEPWSAVMDDADRAGRYGATDLLGWNLGVLDAVCNAVHFAHCQGVVHRDLKPENVMVGPFGQVYVLDWGIAVSVRDDGRFPQAAAQRRVAGTPRYMAPEMVDGDGTKVSERTDVYLLGALLYRILAGHPPHRGLSVKQILASIAGFVPELSQAPSELAALVTEAMHRDPARRPATAEVFRRRVRAFVEHRGAVALAEASERRLVELLGVLADPDVDRVRVYDLFGAIRFGFQEALGVWPEHPSARFGLERAAVALADWELDQGDDRAAEVLLALLDTVPAPLSERLASTRQARLGALDRLERLARDRNPRFGRRVRAYLAALFTVLWTLTPLLGVGRSAMGSLTVGLAWCAIAGVALVRFRDVWMATRTNRTVMALLAAALLGQVVLGIGQWNGAMTPEGAAAAILLLNGTACAGAALLIHRAFALPTVVMLAAFLAFPVLGEARPAVSALGNFLIGGAAVWLWWPRGDHSSRLSDLD